MRGHLMQQHHLWKGATYLHLELKVIGKRSSQRRLELSDMHRHRVRVTRVRAHWSKTKNALQILCFRALRIMSLAWLLKARVQNIPEWASCSTEAHAIGGRGGGRVAMLLLLACWQVLLSLSTQSRRGDALKTKSREYDVYACGSF
mmetsp:Transcript_61811/g.182486  ORF Transcript_61811/g.182486 Transcript_61811/m.182486 type:complete len:146 (-) Transcript_61811:184-621(-)